MGRELKRIEPESQQRERAAFISRQLFSSTHTHTSHYHHHHHHHQHSVICLECQTHWLLLNLPDMPEKMNMVEADVVQGMLQHGAGTSPRCTTSSHRLTSRERSMRHMSFSLQSNATPCDQISVLWCANHARQSHTASCACACACARVRFTDRSLPSNPAKT